MTSPNRMHAFDGDDIRKATSMIRRGKDDRYIARYFGCSIGRITALRNRTRNYPIEQQRIRGTAKDIVTTETLGLGDQIAWREMAKRGSLLLLERWNAALIRNYGRGAV